jgi:hypothetical protein
VADARPVHLEWSVVGAARLELTGVGDVTGRNGVDVRVRTDTIFVLVLTPMIGSQIFAQIAISVSKVAPDIHRFRSVTHAQVPGQVRLEWVVAGAEALAITPYVGDVSGRTSIDVSVSQNTRFTLTATSPCGVQKSATVAVHVSATAPMPKGRSTLRTPTGLRRTPVLLRTSASRHGRG